MHGKGGSQQIFVQHPVGIAVVGAPPLFLNHVPLGVEFAQHGVLHPVGFEGGPEFQLVGRQRHQIGGQILAGEGIVAGAPVLGIDPAEFILDHEGLVALLQLAQLPAQLGQSRGIGILASFQVVQPGPKLFNRLQ